MEEVTNDDDSEDIQAEFQPLPQVVVCESPSEIPKPYNTSTEQVHANMSDEKLAKPSSY